MNGGTATSAGGRAGLAGRRVQAFENRAFCRLQEPNPLLYRCFPLTCARTQE